MSNVRVAVRVRPLNKREEDQGAKVVVQVDGEKLLLTNLKVPVYQEYDNRARVRQFAFDFCYWSVDASSRHFVSQQMVYEDLGSKVLEAIFEGFNACVLAYGQSGSGKTYTMMGPKDDIGLTPRICQGLFDRLAKMADKQLKFHTEVSFLEIYNERVGDLLRASVSPLHKRRRPTLRIREHPKLGPCVQDLSKHVVTDFSSVQALLERGILNRSVAATRMHNHSSRSHAIFTIIFTQARLDEELPSEVVSKIHLVDLAGSERATVGMNKMRLKEGANINKSLVALGSVICALAEKSLSMWSLDSLSSSRSQTSSTGDSISSSTSPLGTTHRNQTQFVPYRDSVLTWLLKDSLGGNSKTIMLATISPASTTYNETMNTLRYAQRAKCIVNKPVINEDPNVKLIRELKAEITRLREMLFNTRQSGISDCHGEPWTPVNEIITRNQDKAQELTRIWIEKWHDFQQQAQKSNCCHICGSGESIVGPRKPYLVGGFDVLSNGLQIVCLNEGETVIGNRMRGSETDPDIVVSGNDVGAEHVRLYVKEGLVILIPSKDETCMLNGVLLSNEATLSQGDVIQIDENCSWKFVDPLICQKGPSSFITDMKVPPRGEIEDLYPPPLSLCLHHLPSCHQKQNVLEADQKLLQYCALPSAMKRHCEISNQQNNAVISEDAKDNKDVSRHTLIANTKADIETRSEHLTHAGVSNSIEGEASVSQCSMDVLRHQPPDVTLHETVTACSSIPVGSSLIFNGEYCQALNISEDETPTDDDWSDTDDIEFYASDESTLSPGKHTKVDSQRFGPDTVEQCRTSNLENSLGTYHQTIIGPTYPAVRYLSPIVECPSSKSPSPVLVDEKNNKYEDKNVACLVKQVSEEPPGGNGVFCEEAKVETEITCKISAATENDVVRNHLNNESNFSSFSVDTDSLDGDKEEHVYSSGCVIKAPVLNKMQEVHHQDFTEIVSLPKDVHYTSSLTSNSYSPYSESHQRTHSNKLSCYRIGFLSSHSSTEDSTIQLKKDVRGVLSSPRRSPRSYNQRRSTLHYSDMNCINISSSSEDDLSQITGTAVCSHKYPTTKTTFQKMVVENKRKRRKRTSSKIKKSSIKASYQNQLCEATNAVQKPWIITHRDSASKHNAEEMKNDMSAQNVSPPPLPQPLFKHSPSRNSSKTSTDELCDSPELSERNHVPHLKSENSISFNDSCGTMKMHSVNTKCRDSLPALKPKILLALLNQDSSPSKDEDTSSEEKIINEHSEKGKILPTKSGIGVESNLLNGGFTTDSLEGVYSSYPSESNDQGKKSCYWKFDCVDDKQHHNEYNLQKKHSASFKHSWPSCDSLTMVYMGPEWGSTETNLIASLQSLCDLDDMPKEKDRLCSGIMSSLDAKTNVDKKMYQKSFSDECVSHNVQNNEYDKCKCRSACQMAFHQLNMNTPITDKDCLSKEHLFTHKDALEASANGWKNENEKRNVTEYGKVLASTDFGTICYDHVMDCGFVRNISDNTEISAVNDIITRPFHQKIKSWDQHRDCSNVEWMMQPPIYKSSHTSLYNPINGDFHHCDTSSAKTAHCSDISTGITKISTPDSGFPAENSCACESSSYSNTNCESSNVMQDKLSQTCNILSSVSAQTDPICLTTSTQTKPMLSDIAIQTHMMAEEKISKPVQTVICCEDKFCQVDDTLTEIRICTTLQAPNDSVLHKKTNGISVAQTSLSEGSNYLPPVDECNCKINSQTPAMLPDGVKSTLSGLWSVEDVKSDYLPTSNSGIFIGFHKKPADIQSLTVTFCSNKNSTSQHLKHVNLHHHISCSNDIMSSNTVEDMEHIQSFKQGTNNGAKSVSDNSIRSAEFLKNCDLQEVFFDSSPHQYNTVSREVSNQLDNEITVTNCLNNVNIVPGHHTLPATSFNLDECCIPSIQEVPCGDSLNDFPKNIISFDEMFLRKQNDSVLFDNGRQEEEMCYFNRSHNDELDKVQHLSKGEGIAVNIKSEESKVSLLEGKSTQTDSFVSLQNNSCEQLQGVWLNRFTEMESRIKALEMQCSEMLFHFMSTRHDHLSELSSSSTHFQRNQGTVMRKKRCCDFHKKNHYYPESMSSKEMLPSLPPANSDMHLYSSDHDCDDEYYKLPGNLRISLQYVCKKSLLRKKTLKSPGVNIINSSAPEDDVPKTRRVKLAVDSESQNITKEEGQQDQYHSTVVNEVHCSNSKTDANVSSSDGSYLETVTDCHLLLPKVYSPIPEQVDSDAQSDKNIPEDILSLLRECRGVRKKALVEIALAHEQLRVVSAPHRIFMES